MTSFNIGLQRQYLEFIGGAFVLSSPYDNPLTRHIDFSDGENYLETVTAMAAEKIFRSAQEIIRIVSGVSGIKEAEGSYESVSEKIISEVQEIHTESDEVQYFLEDAQVGSFLSRVALTGYVSSEPIYNNLCHGRRNQTKTAHLIQPLYLHPKFQDKDRISDF